MAVYSNARKAPVVETVPKDNVPLPFVFRNCPLEPSAVGRLNATLLDVSINLLPSDETDSAESWN